ncbi:MAG: ROK family protein [Chloroflexota bacterium]|nr:ROK family protein [Chloroflexota bacterium]
MLQKLSELGPRSIDELVADTGLGRATVYSALTDDDVLRVALAQPREVRLSKGPGGRAKAFYGLQPFVAVGVEFDRDRVRVCITDLSGNPLWREHVRLSVSGDFMRFWTKDSKGETVRDESFPCSQEAHLRMRLAPDADPADGRTSGAVDTHPGFALQAAVDLVERGLKHLGKVPPAFWPEDHVAVRPGQANETQPVTRDHVLGIGVAMPAPVDLETQTASATVLPGWRGIRPAEALRVALGLGERVQLVTGNDANLGAWAEYHYASRNPDNRYGFTEPPKSLLYIKTAPGPRGVGAGVVAQDSRGEVSIYRGANHAGEIGHIPFDWPADQPGEKKPSEEQKKCPHCGHESCLESRLALPVFLPREDHESYMTWDDVVAHLRTLEPRERRGTREAQAILDASERLGKALGTAVTLFNPNLLVVTGPLSHALADPNAPKEYRDVAIAPEDERPLLTQLKQAAFRDAFKSLQSELGTPAVFRSGLGWWGVALGAALRVLDFNTRQVPFFRAAVEDGASDRAATAA